MQRKTCRPATLLKWIPTQLLPVNIKKFLRTDFFYRTPPVAVSK